MMKTSGLVKFLMVICLVGVWGCSKSATTPDSSNANSSAPGAAASSPTAAEPAPPPAARPVVVVPDGTSIVVTIDQSLSSKTSNSGEPFEATVATPVMVDGA